jgi:hypothetical protein
MIHDFMQKMIGLVMNHIKMAIGNKRSVDYTPPSWWMRMKRNELSQSSNGFQSIKSELESDTNPGQSTFSGLID